MPDEASHGMWLWVHWDRDIAFEYFMVESCIGARLGASPQQLVQKPSCIQQLVGSLCCIIASGDEHVCFRTILPGALTSRMAGLFFWPNVTSPALDRIIMHEWLLLPDYL